MADEATDWIERDEVIAHVTEACHCHWDKARELVDRAVDDLMVRTRTIQGPPRWLEYGSGGARRFSSDDGRTIAIARNDVLRLWPKREINQELLSAHRSNHHSLKRARPVSTAVAEVIKELWPRGIPQTLRAKDRDSQIRARLNEREIRFHESAISRAVQRALKEQRDASNGV